jgi:hypothetical protein
MAAPNLCNIRTYIIVIFDLNNQLFTSLIPFPVLSSDQSGTQMVYENNDNNIKNEHNARSIELMV